MRDFSGQDVGEMSFRDADLRSADFTQATGVVETQFPGANLAGAKLPEEIRDFPSLENVKEIAQNSGKLLVTILLAAIFSTLTAVSAKDSDLFRRDGAISLPILDIHVSHTWFFVLAPLILLSTYICLHLYLQRLWERLQSLPTVFPDGRRIDEKIHPWLLADYTLRSSPRLKGLGLRIDTFQSALYVIMGWYLVPIAIVVLWLRLLCRHDVGLTWFYSILIGASIWIASAFRVQAVQAFETERKRTLKGQVAIKAGLCVAVCFLFGFMSSGAISGPDSARGIPYRLLSGLAGLAGFSTDARMSGAEISVRGKDGTDALTGVSPAELQGLDLRRATLRAAFLARARLEHARFDQSRLEGAHLGEAILEGSRFVDASLDGANLSGASVVGYLDRYRSVRDSNAQKLSSESDWNFVGSPSKYHEAFLDPGEEPIEGEDAVDPNAIPAILELRRQVASCDFRGSSMLRTQLRKAWLDYSRFDGCKLYSTDLAEVKARHSSWKGAWLQDVNLSGGDIRGGSFVDTAFVRVDGSSARIGGSFERGTIRNCDWSQASLSGELKDVYITLSKVKAGSGSVFKKCTFDAVTLSLPSDKEEGTNPPEFEDCFFTFTDLPRRLRADQFVRCTFNEYEVRRERIDGDEFLILKEL